MRKTALAIVAGMLAMGTCAWAADNSGPGASGNAPGHTGKMQGSPNAAGFKKDDTTGSTGTAGSSGMSRSGTSNSTGANDAGSGSSPGAKGAGSGSR
ncbi:hypothetical protein [Methylobacterium nigriterrae]|uniref:hypothetical protein n=1 Tax=Methylobacterium nigriterrae TaxID=3127512 RepID=UPI003013D7D7